MRYLFYLSFFFFLSHCFKLKLVNKIRHDFIYLNIYLVNREAVELLEFSTEELLTMSFIGADNLPLLHESNIEEETKMENGKTVYVLILLI